MESDTLRDMEDPSPIGLATSETFSFLRRCLPEPPLRILEVGCGRGDLLRRLGEAGFEAVGIELSAAEAQAGRAAGLDLREADLLSFDETPFDAVLFTRSLHHLSDLAAAVERSSGLLKPGGLLVAEEFDVEQPDRATASWFYRLQALLIASEALPYDPVPKPSDPLARWRHEHSHDEAVHTGEAMLSGVTRRFDLLLQERPSYLYRYFCGRLPADAKGFHLASEILHAEERLLKAGALRPVGLRFVGRKAEPAEVG
jgi:SAM-dependent methyltransferase